MPTPPTVSSTTTTRCTCGRSAGLRTATSASTSAPTTEAGALFGPRYTGTVGAHREGGRSCRYGRRRRGGGGKNDRGREGGSRGAGGRWGGDTSPPAPRGGGGGKHP